MKSGEFVTRSIARETILVPVRGQVGDLDAIYNLNEVGTFIWEHVNDITSVRQIADAVAVEFEVTPEEAEKDTQQFIKDLEIAGVIEPVPAGGLKNGDIALYHAQRGVTAHRLVRIEGQQFLMRGDAPGSADEPVGQQQILGKVGGTRTSGP